MSEKLEHARNSSRRSVTLSLLVFMLMLIIAVAGVVVAVVSQNSASATQPASTGNDEYHGTVINPPKELSDFTLTDQRGEPASLSDLQGRIVLLYFGYTHCPDFCPATMQTFKKVQELLGNQAQNVAFVFISVDGERDTPEVLASFLETRQVPDFLALTGTSEELKRLGSQFGLYFEKLGEDTQNYMVDHTSASFLIDRQNRLVKLYSFGTKPDFIASDIRAML